MRCRVGRGVPTRPIAHQAVCADAQPVPISGSGDVCWGLAYGSRSGAPFLAETRGGSASDRFAVAEARGFERQGREFGQAPLSLGQIFIHRA